MSSEQIKDFAELASLNDTDQYVLQESGGTVKKTVWGTIKSTLKTYFDSIYLPISYSTPAGLIVPFAGISTPTGWLFCDGSAISRTNYSSLFSALSLTKGTFTVTIASPGVVTLSTHGLATGDCVYLTTTGALPTGLSVNTNYYVIYNDANSFWIATSYANAIAGTKINTSGTQSGTHTLVYSPWGISGATNFLLPNGKGVVLKGSGSQTINTRTKTGPALGSVEEDQGQGHYHQGYQTLGSGSSTTWGSSSTGSALSAALVLNPIKDPITDNTNGTPRTGATTRENSIGVNYIIKY